MLAVLEANTTLLAFIFGLCFVTALLVLAIWFPNPTAFQYTVFRITLALAAAGIAGVIPGMIRLKMQPGAMLMIHAGGALAVFVIVYLLEPAALPPEQEQSAPGAIKSAVFSIIRCITAYLSGRVVSLKEKQKVIISARSYN
ncbi:MAG: hypothetical protein D3911_14735 [Candidatus Electrothrix sp. AW3_4]|nr:hypothetical protein [Candidatus Electrothrix gigas]